MSDMLQLVELLPRAHFRDLELQFDVPQDQIAYAE